MTLSALIRKRDTGNLATAIPAIFATQPKREIATVARIATVAVASPEKQKTVSPVMVAANPIADSPFDPEAFEERAAICEFDGGLTREEAEAIAWHEDDRRRCAHCLNFLPNGVCKVAVPGGLVSARRGFQPVLDFPRRCAGYRPCLDDPDQRPGWDRWPELNMKDTK
jgi:hypothetical protein